MQPGLDFGLVVKVRAARLSDFHSKTSQYSVGLVESPIRGSCRSNSSDLLRLHRRGRTAGWKGRRDVHAAVEVLRQERERVYVASNEV